MRLSELRFQAVDAKQTVSKVGVFWNSSGMLARIDWVFDDESPASVSSSTLSCISMAPPAQIAELVGRIKEYFRSGKPLGSLPWEFVDQSEWTPFQRQVYAAITRIPHGETRTYGWVAARIGNTAATRAVGQSLKNNPLPIFIPCHRVVAADSLGGFMGASDPNDPQMLLKQKLLNLEQSYLSPTFAFASVSLG